MRGKNQRGFTIIEVMLFFAISTALFASLVFGIQYMIGRARFTDSVASLRTVIKSQYEEVLTGINERQDSIAQDVCGSGSETVASGSSGCLLIGKVIGFTDGSGEIKINYIIGNSVDPASVGSDISAIQLANPRLSTVAESTQQIQWSSVFTQGIRLDNGSNNIVAVAIVRSPISSNVTTYALSNVPTSGNLLPISSATPDVSTAILVKNLGSGGAAGGAVCVNAGSSSANVGSLAPVDPEGEFSGQDLTDLEDQCLK